jgi:hypothetical protein
VRPTSARNQSVDVGFIGLPLPAVHRISLACGFWRSKPTAEAALLHPDSRTPGKLARARPGQLPRRSQTARGGHHDYASAPASRRFPLPCRGFTGQAAQKERTGRRLARLRARAVVLAGSEEERDGWLRPYSISRARQAAGPAAAYAVADMQRAPLLALSCVCVRSRCSVLSDGIRMR